MWCIFLVIRKTYARQAQICTKMAQWTHVEQKTRCEESMCLRFHEHSVKRHRLNTSFRAFKPKLDDPLPELCSADYQSSTASQYMFKRIKGACRQRQIWLGINGGPCHMAGFIKNQADCMVKRCTDVITGWSESKPNWISYKVNGER